ncbi:ABC transporter permease [Butyrivibrio fibrisolvens]|jgi:ABC-2 type transport system permease protein|uniref:ABC-2 family transporter protein n=1 Tax=Lachnospiraceae TaxID=186803 RepID=UPI0003F5BE2E|nr:MULTISPECIES: ABC-2 family transporter protein [Lachnospiraceae]MDC7280654.1 ABC transporter permease [Butyrivibrio fibrisolvens]SFI36813.1 ABC-2 type transport system permease protein [Pseudobutyrivibrio sp. OR37]SFN93061.1 ABC-2 type transport system permease protein [Pseudobutyrivibrio sp. UC1225]
MNKRLYKVFISQSIQECLVYRSTSIFVALFGIMFFSIEMITGIIYYEYSDTILGWTRNDYFSLICTSNIILSMYQVLFVSAHENLSDDIIEGNLDYVFVRPVKSFWYYALYRLDIPSAVNLVIAIIIQMVIISKSNYYRINIIEYVIFIPFAMMFVFLVNQLMVMFSFWKEKTNKLMGVPESLIDASTRPKVIYPNSIIFFLTWVLPFFTAINGPVEILKGNISVVELVWFIIFLVVLSIIVGMVWKRGLAKYASAN